MRMREISISNHIYGFRSKTFNSTVVNNFLGLLSRKAVIG